MCNVLVAQTIIEVLDSIEIPKEFQDWALNVIKENNKDEFATRKKIIKNQQKKYNDCIKKLDKLTNLFTPSNKARCLMMILVGLPGRSPRSNLTYPFNFNSRNIVSLRPHE